jgi:GNAT superfamily N-acetyltransferase
MVAERYRAARAEIPFLPATYMDATAIAPRLEAWIGRLPGVVALEDGEPAGFVLSLLVLNRGERMAYVPDFAHGAEIGREYELYRRMYAEIADQWLASGCFMHGITLYPNDQAAVAAWFSLGFGLVVMDALRIVSSNVTEQHPPLPTGIEIRRAGPEDLDLIAPLELALSRHLAASPAFLPLIVDGGRSALSDWLADPSHALWIAFSGGEAAAYLRFEPSENLVLPTSAATTVSITGAYTREDLRGRGIGAALLQTGLRWAGAAGYTRCSVDFESANLPGSAFWLRQFEPVTHSLIRRVDPRLAWASVRRDASDVWHAYEKDTWIG